MKFASVLSHRVPWLNLSASVLLVLLQRTPAVRALAQAKDYVLASRAGELLRAAFTAATLGALHSRAGATTFTPSTPNPVRGKVGELLQFGFTYVGTPSSPATFQFSGSLPPGLSFVPAPIGNTIRSGTPAITGRPTQPGFYQIMVQGFNAEGLTNNIQQTIQFDIEAAETVPLAITAQPQSQTVNVGANVTFSVTATGTPPLAYQWRHNGSNILGATGASLNLPNVQTSNAGAYTVEVRSGTQTVMSSAANLVVNTPGGGGTAPTITSQPVSVTAAAGSTAALMVAASGNVTGYQWNRAGQPIAGATAATLLLPNVSAAQAGSYTVTVQGGGQSVQSQPATLGVAAGSSRLANLSVRTTLGTGQSLIVGFAMNGAKNVLLRGIGPTLGSFGVSGSYADPRLEMFDGTAKVAENDNWDASLAAAFTSVAAFPLTNGSRDAALQTQITGSRTAQISGPSSGVVLVEVYDSGAGNAVRLVNVSARNLVGTGDNIMIAGFVVDGTVGKTLLIRAVGPTLASFGVTGTLADPVLEIHASGGGKVVENDNWSAAVGATFDSVGAFPLVNGSRDAALVVTLMPGAYSAQVSGLSNGTGEALVEVYEVP